MISFHEIYENHLTRSLSQIYFLESLINLLRLITLKKLAYTKLSAIEVEVDDKICPPHALSIKKCDY